MPAEHEDPNRLNCTPFCHGCKAELAEQLELDKILEGAEEPKIVPVPPPKKSAKGTKTVHTSEFPRPRTRDKMDQVESADPTSKYAKKITREPSTCEAAPPADPNTS